ncbi:MULTISPECIES: helix-turn-helix transcriptional regulator [Cupriavidus]|uniref:helix-turn-helix transcriptional regulator n=1 Tax=Cupriavidus TaxID=106589 RepID=UPI000DACD6A2|nr:helix-turn-helix transcriptional regulator [Cupriavidus alkaliphilus]
MSELARTLAKEFQGKEYAHAYVNEAVSMRLAAQIKVLREQRGWTQEELARRAGMKQERISVLEDTDYDSWTLKTLRAIAEAFDVSVSASFEPFSKAIMAVVNLNKDCLRVTAREEDLEDFCRHTFFHNDGQWRSTNRPRLATVIAMREPARPNSNRGTWQTVAVATEEQLLCN